MIIKGYITAGNIYPSPTPDRFSGSLCFVSYTLPTLGRNIPLYRQKKVGRFTCTTPDASSCFFSPHLLFPPRHVARFSRKFRWKRGAKRKNSGSEDLDYFRIRKKGNGISVGRRRKENGVKACLVSIEGRLKFRISMVRERKKRVQESSWYSRTLSIIARIPTSALE